MKIKNATNLPNRFLQRLTRWVRSEVTNKGNKGDGGRMPTIISFRPGGITGAKWTFAATRQKLTARLGPVEMTDEPGAGLYAKGRLFKLVVSMAAAWRPSRVPEGELGLYRQPIGKAFSDHAEELVSQWREGEQPGGKLTNRKLQQLNKATAAVRRWKTRHKLAETKLKLWTRRVRQIETALGKLETHQLENDDENDARET